jgi:hypothetical protein
MSILKDVRELLEDCRGIEGANISLAEKELLKILSRGGFSQDRIKVVLDMFFNYINGSVSSDTIINEIKAVEELMDIKEEPPFLIYVSKEIVDINNETYGYLVYEADINEMVKESSSLFSWGKLLGRFENLTPFLQKPMMRVGSLILSSEYTLDDLKMELEEE